MELFTSEGCSSCPSADETLARLTDRAEQSGQRLIALELHVDYWNYLGWVDPFSDPVHAQRQSAYAKRFGETGMYTPQLVVSGREQLVGSDEGGALAAIERALDRSPSVTISVSARRDDGDLLVDYAVTAPNAVEVQLALAQDRAETHVTRGENARQLLRHRHVVRAFESVHLAASGGGQWRVAASRLEQPGIAKPVWFLAAYATDPSTLAVLGATSTKLEPAL
ncbi:MAG TPA: DUF1223 domain-containing protein [Polyangiaceae bacterium]|nr:DUF1223 domain-containing protein [Polyangiaceae bacterium]